MHARRADEQLAELVAGGDAEAFRELYERWFAALYDFAARIVNDRELAADVVQATFTKAWSRLREGAEVAHVKPWLYAVTRNEAIDTLRRRAHSVAVADEGESSPFARPDPSRSADPETVLADRELADLVWSAARGLSPQDYSLLDLHVRRELSADEIADALGLKKGAVYTRLSRLRDAFETSFAVTLLMRRGRRECGDLAALLDDAGAGDAPTPAIRQAVGDHLERCARCRHSRARFVAPDAIFAGLAPVPALAGAKEAIWAALETDAGRAGREQGEARASGRARGARRPRAVAGAVALATLVVAAALPLTRAQRQPAPPESRTVVRQQVRVTLPADPRITGYSIRWTRAPDTVPDERVDLGPDVREVVSPTFTRGRLWLHVRVRRLDGGWSRTIRSGPYRPGTGRRVDPP